MKKKIFIKTFGCQMNEYDSNRIFDITKKINYLKTENLKEADCYVINTCHIREKATEKVYHDVGRIKKEFRGKRKPIVVVAGCVAQAEGDILLKKDKYIDAVVGPQSYHRLNEIISKINEDTKRINLTDFEVIEKFDNLNIIKNSSSNVSSFLTIQEGCNKFCKFCVVPYTRGEEYSRSVNELVKESFDLVNNGAREITLLGQNVNAYNYNGKKLSDLINETSKIEDLKRIRYTTSHPIDFSEDLIDAHGRNLKLMPLIHLPVQSGSNKILKDMNRKHTIEDYLEVIKKLKKINPLIKFSSDFIIGYPGETEKDFNDTLQLIDEVEYINFYSFIFSPRPGTPAAKLKKIDEILAKERLNIFQKKAEEVKMRYRKNLFNKECSVLFENELKDKTGFFGKDEFSNSVIVKSSENLIGKIKKVIITNGNHNTLFGAISKKENKKDFAA
ncbi:tRNA (N6-isopentenyl adenosine(37)-C2)-methylthiotransferase MiaB [Candidatus Pelagibacter bacterium]|nr:tRNA (N6-isopentenyl adenosine(37)-C2)-methylthiotransferase MiaB [Candidatus Pelagibacter bacterium]